MKKAQQIGVFSGTFDPFHIAHIEVCLAARASCNLETVLIMVERAPKRKYQVSSYKKRVTMVDLAISEFPSLRLIEPDADNITIDNTLPLLKNQFPKAKYWYIVGSDIVMYLSSWRNLSRLFEHLKLCVVLRTNEDEAQTKSELNKLKKQYKKIDYVIIPEVWPTISSSKIRKQIRDSGYSPFLHRDVMDFILTNNIY